MLHLNICISYINLYITVLKTVSYRSDIFGTITDIKKGKAVLLQAWTGPEGSRKFRFPDFMTMAQDDGKVVSLRHRPPLRPGNTPGTHFC